MIGIDTNVLLRFLIDDPEAGEQSAKAQTLLASMHHVYVAYVVFIETMWVLSRRYRLPRDRIAGIAAELLQHPSFVCENGAILSRAVDVYRAENIGFGDALALISDQDRNCVLHTFDRKLAKLEGATRVVSAG